jgi:hypothetical protein
LALCLANASTFVQAAMPPPAERSAKDIEEINDRVASWLADCLQDWDASTHMTREEWQTTCDRVAAERRIQLLQDDLDSMTSTLNAR